MSETVQDIIGKGFKYEERVELTTLVDNISGTKVAFVGTANWGPVNIPTQVIKSFSNYFGTQVNRDVNTKDYSGMTAAEVLKIVPSCFFTRITDGTDQLASLLLSKMATAGSFTGVTTIQGQSLKINDSDKIFTIKVDNGSDTVVTLTRSARCAAQISDALSATNFSSGDYIEFFVDGVAYQYIIASSSDPLCKMTGTGKYDDSYYGGVAGGQSIVWIDRLVYSLQNSVIQNFIARIIRKYGTSQISINSAEYGASSSIKITSFPVVFPAATITSPLQSTSSNTLADDIISSIDSALTGIGDAFINSSGKMQINSATTGTGSVIHIQDEPVLNRTTDNMSTILNLLGTAGGTFSVNPNWTTLTDNLSDWLAFVTAQTVSYGNAVAAIGGYQELSCTATFPSATAAGLAAHADYSIKLALNGAAAAEITGITLAGSESWAQVATAIQSAVGNDYEVTIVANKIRIKSDAIGTAQSSIAITDGVAGHPLLTSIAALGVTYADVAAGTAVPGTHGSMDIIFSGTGIVDPDAVCPLIPGTYKLRLTIDAIAAADESIIVPSGRITWGDFVTTYLGAISGITTTITGGGDIKITSTHYGVNQLPSPAPGADIIINNAAAPATGGVAWTYGSGNVTVSTIVGSVAVNAAAHTFTVTSAQAFLPLELFFTISSGTAQTKFEIYKDSLLIESLVISALDISNGYARVTFNAVEAGTYTIMVRDVAPGTAISSITIDNMFLGLIRPTENVNLLAFLGVKDAGAAYDYTDIDFIGTAAVLDMGTFEAVYTGADGNNLYFTKGTSNGIPFMAFYNGTSLIARINNFSYTLADDTFFGKLINNDSRMQKYLTYINPAVPPVSISPIADGTYNLSGGTSGISNAISDVQYGAALDEYKNMDIFDIDILCVTGNSTATVISKIQTICEYRKDCFGVVDPPETIAGKAIGSIDQMIYWHNGLLPATLNMKLDSKYLVTYFPWVLITTASPVTSNQWMPPSEVTVPAIVTVDRQFNSYTPAAGKFAKLPLVNDIAVYLTEEDKGRAYDDNIGNNINPIVFTQKQGFFIDGNKTTQRIRNSYNRITTMKVSLFIKRNLMEIVPDYYYLPITKDTRDEFEAIIKKQIITPLINAQAIKPNEITDWQVITDPALIDADNTIIEASNGMISLIEWTPINKLEKIKVISVMKDTQVIVQL